MSPDTSLFPRAAIVTAADRQARNRIQLAHVKQLWIFLGSVLVFFTLLNAIRHLSKRLTTLPEPSKFSTKEKSDEELNKTPRPIPSLFQRSLSALRTGFRIAFFRWSVPIGPGSIASVSELTFIFVYIAAMFVWLLVDSKSVHLLYLTNGIMLYSSPRSCILHVSGSCSSHCI